MKVTFRGVTRERRGLRLALGLVATDAAITTPRYSALQKGADGELEFCVNSGESLFLVVVGTPSVQKQIVWDQMYNTIHRYPWMVELARRLARRLQERSPRCLRARQPALERRWVRGRERPGERLRVGPYATVLGGNLSRQRAPRRSRCRDLRDDGLGWHRDRALDPHQRFLGERLSQGRGDVLPRSASSKAVRKRRAARP